MDDRTFPKTTIRQATAEDAPVIAKIINAAWRRAYAGIVPQGYLDTLEDLPRTQRLAEGLARFADLRYFVFEEDGKPVGTASLHATYDKDIPCTAEFSFFYFLPRVWRRGYGTQLLGRLKQEAAAQGYKLLCCWVLEANTRAISFYESQGMLQDGARQTVTIEVPLPAVRCICTLK